jgi:hypothetical protein
MPSIQSLAGDSRWDECHAMLDRGKGDVHERDDV